MPISSSRNRLTRAAANEDHGAGPAQLQPRSGARSVPVCSVGDPGADQRAARASASPSPQDETRQGGAVEAAAPEAGHGKPRDKVKLPLITRIQNSLFGRSRSHGSAVADRPEDAAGQPPSPGTPRRRRLRRQPRHRQPDSPEFALRKIRFFAAPPEPAPLTLCFTHPGVELSHRDVIRGVQSMHAVDVGDIDSVQFVDMNVILGTAGVSNRWLVKVKDYDTRYLLLCDGFKINGEYVILRKYDDVNMEDYREYMRRKDTLASDEHRDAVQRLLAI